MLLRSIRAETVQAQVPIPGRGAGGIATPAHRLARAAAAWPTS